MKHLAEKKPFVPPVCPYCGKTAILVDGAALYPTHTRLHEQKFWACIPCQAWVGCHKNSRHHAPLGRLADAKLRRAKINCHAVFDSLWRAEVKVSGCSIGDARGSGYKWLAEQMGIDRRECHIGMFSLERAEQAIKICAAVKGGAAA